MRRVRLGRRSQESLIPALEAGLAFWIPEINWVESAMRIPDKVVTETHGFPYLKKSQVGRQESGLPKSEDWINIRAGLSI